MSRSITINLPEAQCDALAEEAKAAGRTFFDHCRQKLLANTTTTEIKGGKIVSPGFSPDGDHHRQRGPEPDRLDRLEEMMMEMGRAIQNIANPVHVAPDRATQEPLPDEELGDIVEESLRAAEASAAAIEREPARISGGARPVGTRMRSALAVGGVPSHLEGHFPS